MALKRLNDSDFGLKIYNRFPPNYREDDLSQKFALKRYLESINDGGFKPTIQDLNGILSIVDSGLCNSSVIPFLYEQYGLEIFNGIPEEFLRNFLPYLGDVWKRKGSIDTLEFITASMSGIRNSTQVTYDASGNPILTSRLEMDYNLLDYFPDPEQFKRLMEKFTPFYCDLNIVYSYVFGDKINLHSEDEVGLNRIRDVKTENIGLRRLGVLYDDNSVLGWGTLGIAVFNNELLRIPTEFSKDKIFFTYSEPASLTKDAESLSQKMTFKERENGVFSPTDSKVDKVQHVVSEQTPFALTIANTVNGAVFGASLFNEREFADHLVIDKHTITHHDSKVVVGVESNSLRTVFKTQELGAKEAKENVITTLITGKEKCAVMSMNHFGSAVLGNRELSYTTLYDNLD